MSVQDSFIFFVGAVITLVCFCVFFSQGATNTDLIYHWLG